MNASLLAVLNDAERLLVAETGRDQLAAIDEDAAIELEARIRRARNKYVSQYRRGASAAVAEKGGRGKARPENTRARMKAEVFEEALSKVSRRIAVLARQAAAQLRAVPRPPLLPPQGDPALRVRLPLWTRQALRCGGERHVLAGPFGPAHPRPRGA
jgi:hypothetical protein